MGSAWRRNREQNFLAFAIIFNAQNHLRAARQPLSCRLRSFFVVPLHQEKFCVGRQLLECTDVANGRPHIKQIRLVFWINGIERNICWDDGVDLPRVLPNLFVLTQKGHCNQTVGQTPNATEDNENDCNPVSQAWRKCFAGEPLRPA